ncbi:MULTISPECIES: hypothetical protein [unclassified Tolypothrix]|uniref:hypothetical protein n=1 Tax=unclassified Tolypothrix TaxID=2649714 RepID=UPI0005EABDA2|nr:MULTISPECIES: hypothetical protein [unclassified Tolypothrix]BAY88742.1 hypothetical protein NIES3275_07420 [Microchaete diplosiphon NIES-3275]EKF01625.1 hypothetical protein FDUTEX481_07782 [Tolypothrix sp. PCC 7601]MBE9087736.1 hypothetical protein [Tolypothrix sp. LEGE 11397]UYD29403.1 hypothetical protein HGR01_16085 [Tolypothrix sp. PCC 7712]UYD34689.1 hypothetical protein HG267_02240 [Tolypothrix sp. PCC 7601]
MTFNTKIAVALFAASAGVFGVSSHAFAGEGGAAGSAAFSVDSSNGKLTGAAETAAVGKNNAAATATNVSIGGFQSNTATAVGSAGKITVTIQNSDALEDINISGVVSKIEAGVDRKLGTAQKNQLTHQSELNRGNPNLVTIGQ